MQFKIFVEISPKIKISGFIFQITKYLCACQWYWQTIYEYLKASNTPTYLPTYLPEAYTYP